MCDYSLHLLEFSLLLHNGLLFLDLVLSCLRNGTNPVKQLRALLQNFKEDLALEEYQNDISLAISVVFSLVVVDSSLLGKELLLSEELSFIYEEQLRGELIAVLYLRIIN